MARGGARSRSGPPPDPTSERSEKRNYTLTALEPYDGEVPAFPLPPRTVAMVNEDGELVDDDEESERVWNRELDMWAWAWTTPQACAWIGEPYRWPEIGLWVRTFVVCEGDRATAADKNSLHRFAENQGLTPNGLKMNGWAIAKPAHQQDTPATEDDARDHGAPPAPVYDARNRFASGGR